MILEIDEKFSGKTVKEVLFGELKFSTNTVKKLKFRENGITVNGEFVTVRYILKNGDILSLKTEDGEEDTCPYMIPVDLPVKIAYEDESLTVVDKPPFMPAHPSYAHRLDTVANALAFRYSGSPFVFRPINRLDRDTSGLMLTARNRLDATTLYKSMIKGEIEKMYIAILEKTPPEKSGIIKTYMRREQDSIIKRCVCDENDSKAKIAVTAYKVLYTDKNLCAVAATPVTGRTHQLRVHFSHIGCPLCGDNMYGGGLSEIDRHALHSAYLSFPHPKGGRVEAFSPLPEDMTRIFGNEKSEEIFELFKSETNGELNALREEAKV